MIAKSFQEEQNFLEPTARSYTIATVGSVYSDGITLIFPGTSTASSKRYNYNKSATFSSGDRVFLIKDSGTYIVAFPLKW